MEDELAIGIDLGTTYSCVAVCRNGKVEIIPNECGNFITPSYVSFSEDKRLIGDEAKNQAAVNPENTVFDVKRIIGREFDDENVQADMKHWPFEVINSESTPKIKVMFKNVEKLFFAEEISAMLLAKMKELAESHTEKQIINAVITVPAYFNNSQRQATRDAGKIAGLNVIRLITEPTAAAIAYGLQKRNIMPRNILIYDLGGGTFDVSILSIKGEKIHVKAVGGNTHLGGEDFDSNMMTYVVNDLKKTKNIDILNNRGATRRLRNACEKNKKLLSTLKETKIKIINVVKDVDYERVFSRSLFEELNAPLFQLTIDKVAKCLQDAGVKKSEIDDIVLVGGSTRIPKIREILKTFFDNRELNSTINPDEAVAYGAAVMAANLQGSKCKEIQEIQFFDVTPLSLGVDLSNDRTAVLIPRNSTIPIEKKKIYSTSFHNQKEVAIPVYEGEHTLSKHNHFLGQFGVTGYPPKPKGYNKFEVTFKLDNDGILKVSAVEKSSAKGGSKTFYCDKGRLSKEEIDHKITEAEHFKSEENKGKGLTNIINSIIAYCNETKSNLRKEPYKHELSPLIKSIIFENCDDTLEWIKTTLSDDLYEFMQKKEDIETFCKKLMKR